MATDPTEVQSDLKVSLWRGGAQGRYQDYAVRQRQNQTVLDVVTFVQRHLDPTLSYRFACRVGMCGSCAMTVNGRPRWTCRTHVSKVAEDGRLEIGPLENLPVIKDLATDMSRFLERWRQAKGAFVPTDPRRPGRADPSRQRHAHRRQCRDRIPMVGSPCALIISDRNLRRARVSSAQPECVKTRQHAILPRTICYTPLSYPLGSESHVFPTAREKSKVLNRVRRIRGQIEAVEPALEQEIGCADVMQLIAAARGAINGLMGEVMEDHIRMHVIGPGPDPNSERAQATEELIDVVRSYLK